MLYGSLFAGQLFRGGLFKGSLFGAGGSVSLAALIRALFGADEQGGLWLPGPVDTFTDTAGATAAVVTNTAARNNDRSPNAAHALQASAGNRPALGRTVEGGRRNLLLNSGFAGAVSGTPGTAPTGWSFFGAGGILTVDPIKESLKIAVAASRHIYGMTISVDANSDYVFSFRFAGLSTNIFNIVSIVSPPLGTSLSYQQDNNAIVTDTSTVTTTTEDSVLRVFISTADASGSASIRFGYGVNDNRTGEMEFWNVQFEKALSNSDYQRVGASALDVTEAGKPELYYLRDDGIDDSLVATFSASLGTACTTIIAHSAGLTTLTGQTIGTTYDILQSTDVFGAIVVDRALTAGEQAMADAYLGGLHP